MALEFCVEGIPQLKSFENAKMHQVGDDVHQLLLQLTNRLTPTTPHNPNFYTE